MSTLLDSYLSIYLDGYFHLDIRKSWPNIKTPLWMTLLVSSFLPFPYTPLSITINPPGVPSITSLPLLESVFSSFISIYPVQTNNFFFLKSQNPLAIYFLFLRLSREVSVHHLIPEGTATPSSTLPLLKLNTSNPQMAALHLARPPSHRGWHFSHFTHHYIQPVFIAAARQRGREERLFFSVSPLFSFFHS